MPTLADPHELLERWEAAAALPPAARVIALVPLDPGPTGDPLDLPVAVTAGRAAQAFREAFGPSVAGVAACDRCGETLDVDVPLDSVPGPPRRDSAVVTVAGRPWLVRCPTGRDLLAASAGPDPLRALLARCVQDADGRPADPDLLSPATLVAVDAAAEDLAGAASVVLRSACPTCAAELVVAVDVGELLWQRVRQAVPEVLREVAVLASAFGWAEADLLAMTATRRHAYLVLAGGGA